MAARRWGLIPIFPGVVGLGGEGSLALVVASLLRKTVLPPVEWRGEALVESLGWVWGGAVGGSGTASG